VKMVWTALPSHLSQFCTAEISNKEKSEIFCWGEHEMEPDGCNIRFLYMQSHVEHFVSQRLKTLQ